MNSALVAAVCNRHAQPTARRLRPIVPSLASPCRGRQRELPCVFPLTAPESRLQPIFPRGHHRDRNQHAQRELDVLFPMPRRTQGVPPPLFSPKIPPPLPLASYASHWLRPSAFFAPLRFKIPLFHPKLPRFAVPCQSGLRRVFPSSRALTPRSKSKVPLHAISASSKQEGGGTHRA